MFLTDRGLPRVRKSENFPDSKIFVTKTFRMMRVNCFNFQICDKCAEGCVCKILSIRMFKICPMGYIYNGHYLHLSTFLNTLIENMQNSIQETSRHLFRSSGHFQIIWIHFLDTFQIIQAYFLHYPDNFQIIRKFSRSSGHFPNQPDTFYGLSGHFLDNHDTFSRSSRHFLDCQETFQIIRTLSSSATHLFYIIRTLLVCLDTFKIIKTYFRSSRHFPDHLDTLHIICILYSIWTFFK